MYEAIFFEDACGDNPVGKFIEELDKKAVSDKSARIQLKQILFAIDLLERVGTRSGQPHVKHIRDDIWEIRPGDNRILFFVWKRNFFVLLHSFRKTSTKTPTCEIEKAERELNDWISRHGK